MAYSTRTIGIIVASTISIVMIGIAVVASGPLPFHWLSANAASTHELLVAYASKDSDQDGLPDWEEALYATDPGNAHSIRPDLSDGEAVAQGLVAPKFATATTTPVSSSAIPGVAAESNTVTDQFARNFFETYLRTRAASGPLTPDEVASFVEQQVSALEAKQATVPAYTLAQLHITAGGSTALVEYAGAVEAVLDAPDPYDRVELDYYSDAVVRDDAAALKAVRGISEQYRTASRALLAVAVPEEAAAAHLRLVNALAQKSAVLADMGALDTDPVRAMIGTGRFASAHAEFQTALAQLSQVFDRAGVGFTSDMPGYTLYQTGAQLAH